MSYIITIAREYASGGRLIAKKLAKELDIPFYDRRIIDLAARQSGMSENIIEQAEQKRASSFLYNLYFSSSELPLSDQVFLVQSNIIKSIAEKGSCIIVGRCADYVLRNNPDCFNVFVHAPLDVRMKRARDEYGSNEKNLEKFILAQDKKRASYYHFYSDKKWGMAKNYHLSVDSSMGIDFVVKIIKEMVNQKEEKNKNEDINQGK